MDKNVYIEGDKILTTWQHPSGARGGSIQQLPFTSATIHYVLLRQEEFIAVENQIGMRFSDWATWPRGLVVAKIRDWALAQRINSIAQAMRKGA